MLTFTRAFTGFSVDDVEVARRFYGETLGLDVRDAGMGIIELFLPGGGRVIVYPKGEEHQPATYTVLDFVVADVGAALRELAGLGIQPLRYPGMPQDEDGAMRGHGPDIAWFADPAGNVLAVIADED
ncbi:MAG TPA: VOC family protein [Actinotalea sp.]|nr:VOC family protein [Actinotalea sp.]